MATERQRTARRASRRPTNARLAGMGYVPPCDPTLHDEPPNGRDWIHEIKWDGFRAQAHLVDGDVTVYSRGGLDWTKEFSTICQALKKLSVRSAVIDGEAVVIGPSGKPDFQALRRELRKKNSRIRYYVFDLLELNGDDLRELPLLERKHKLRMLLRRASETIVYVDHLEGDSRAIIQKACEFGLEGIISKRADSPYKSGRQEIWIKSKCQLTDNFPIVAFVEKLGAKPRRIASLYVGRRAGDQLLYAGKVQTGYTLTAAEDAREALDPYIRKSSPLSVPVKKPKATWVEPVVQAEVAYSSTTDDGLLRQATFKGLRDDLTAAATRSKPSRPPSDATSHRSSSYVSPKNILQLLPDAPVPEEADLRAYWKRVAKAALEHLGRRPLKLVRHVGRTVFYHKGPLPDVPEAVHQLTITKREGGEGVRLWVDDVPGLLGLVDMGVIELHPWNSTVDDVERADRLVFDLDPGEGVEWPFLVDTALKLREVLWQEGLDSWPKVTGGKGIHLMAPLAEKLRHDEAHRYSRSLVERIATSNRKRYTLSASMTERPGRLFLDYLRNGRGTTAIGAFSPRARKHFPIARPVTWKEVERGTAPDSFTMDSPGSTSASARSRSGASTNKARPQPR